MYPFEWDFSSHNMFYDDEFYQIDRLEPDGFLFDEDQSLRFRVRIKRH